MRELCVCLFKAEGIFDSYGSTVSTGTEQQKQIHAWMHACIQLVICIVLRSTFLQPCFHNAPLGFAQMPTTCQTLRNKWCLCTAEDVITEEWRNFVIEAAETYGAEIGKYLRVKPVQDTHLQMVRLLDGLFRRDFDWCIDSSNIHAAFQTPQLHRRNQGLILNGSQNAIISFQHVVVYHAWQIFALLHCFLLFLIKGNLIFSKSEGTFVSTKQRFSFASCKLQVIFKGF